MPQFSRIIWTPYYCHYPDGYQEKGASTDHTHTRYHTFQPLTSPCTSILLAESMSHSCVTFIRLAPEYEFPNLVSWCRVFGVAVVTLSLNSTSTCSLIAPPSQVLSCGCPHSGGHHQGSGEIPTKSKCTWATLSVELMYHPGGELGKEIIVNMYLSKH